jgi:structural maintenance of chromosome 4
MITMGGNAEIELIDSMDPFSEGVVLSIMPPKKSWRAIANLSGGEKTLASLALVFALHVFKVSFLFLSFVKTDNSAYAAVLHGRN